MAERHLYIEGYGNFAITEREAERLERGESITLNIFPDAEMRRYAVEDMGFTAPNCVPVDSPTVEALNHSAKWAGRRYYDRHSKPGTRSVHNKGEAIMEPDWAKPTLDERLTVNTDPAKSAHDPISHPAHYTEGRKYEPKDVIRDWGLNFNLGSAVKYLSRAGRKGAMINDLEKAKTFIQFEIEALAEEGGEEE